jgi:hypothetical protein
VLGASLSVIFMPLNGKSYAIVIGIAAGYVAAAAGYWAVVGRPSRGPSGEGGGADGAATPSSSTQASNS